MEERRKGQGARGEKKRGIRHKNGGQATPEADKPGNR